MNYRLLNLRLRLRWAWKDTLKFFGICYDCGTRLNDTGFGNKHCPECGRIK